MENCSKVQPIWGRTERGETTLRDTSSLRTQRNANIPATAWSFPISPMANPPFVTQSMKNQRRKGRRAVHT